MLNYLAKAEYMNLCTFDDKLFDNLLIVVEGIVGIQLHREGFSKK
jgi:hypothetical protein